jgi:uncharacterized protein YcbX
MTRVQVGSIKSIWRYPVKSMLGEEVVETTITRRGLAGDRGYALLDPLSGRVASAKNPKKWARLLEFQAAFVEPPQSYESLPPVTVTLPTGEAISSHSPEISQVLSGILGREVQWLASPPEAPVLEQYWPPVEGTPRQEVFTDLQMPGGTFFDSCPIHAITTATLARLQQLYPEGCFDPCRFRPNLLIEPATEEIAFVEDAWVGGILAIGDTVRLSIDTSCPRCVVTTLAQSGLPADLNILRTTAQYNQVMAGIRLSVLEMGILRQGDPVWLEGS